ncbi:metallophosphoesterase [Proteiniclasticum sp. QWL-01]|uniref:metallophosphoesterase family protein n=1 Tax=Proteiniclasticum sp. QWL-01 TaxID=3036945 RepID=UPI00241177C4|nr:metallophosphoesterase [Proteiniclasticum sp. QWL-01]WFF74574.1 metallophosphoesterase [Proteiniclasticum sp. QWL-01]
MIGVLSDTHRNRRAVEKAFQLFQHFQVTTVFCLGDLCSDVADFDIEYDMAVYCVAGNMDYSSPYPAQAVHEVDGIRFLLTHGHTLDVRYTHQNLLEEAKASQCQAALYGHTHVPFNSMENGILVLNPGSASEPRGHSRPAAAMIETRRGELTAQVYWLDDPLPPNNV